MTAFVLFLILHGKHFVAEPLKSLEFKAIRVTYMDLQAGKIHIWMDIDDIFCGDGIFSTRFRLLIGQLKQSKRKQRQNDQQIYSF